MRRQEVDGIAGGGRREQENDAHRDELALADFGASAAAGAAGLSVTGVSGASLVRRLVSSAT